MKQLDRSDVETMIAILEALLSKLRSLLDDAK